MRNAITQHRAWPLLGDAFAARAWGKFAFAVSLDRHIIAQNSCNAMEVAFFVRHGYQSPIAVSRWEFGNVNQSRVSVSQPRRWRN
jgi:hypothetical protein